jgi:hypothetical protein
MTTTEPAPEKLRADFGRWWYEHATVATAWNGVSKAPNQELAMLHLQCWKLFRDSEKLKAIRNHPYADAM